jgi:hypothetical protein
VWDFYALAALQGLLAGPYEHLRRIIAASEGSPDAIVDVAAGFADLAIREREARQ